MGSATGFYNRLDLDLGVGGVNWKWMGLAGLRSTSFLLLLRELKLRPLRFAIDACTQPERTPFLGLGAGQS